MGARVRRTEAIGTKMTEPSFFVLHRWGKSERASDPDVLHSLLAELDERTTDDEHVSVSVRRPDGWCVGAYASGLVLLENVEDLTIEPRHLYVRDRAGACRLLTLLARGDLAALEREPWRPGNG